MFKKPFSFKGRIRRLEYALSFSVFVTFYFIVGPIVASRDSAGLLGLLIIPIMWLLLAQGAKRCHDIGRNGLWQIVPMFWIVLMIAKGHNEINEYGNVNTSRNI